MAQMLIRVNEEMDIALKDLQDIHDSRKHRETEVEDITRDYNLIVANVYAQWRELDGRH